MLPKIRWRHTFLFFILGLSLGGYLVSWWISPQAVFDQDEDGYPAFDANGAIVDCDDSNPDMFPGNIEIPNDSIDQNCDGIFLDLNPHLDQEDTKEVVLYTDFIFDEDVTEDTIVNNSRLIKVNGVIASAELHVIASATDYGYDKTRKHSVYFYIDNGIQGGHLGVAKEDNLIVGGDYFTILTSPMQEDYDLSVLPLSISTGDPKPLDVLTILNSQSKHYIGAFVSTGIYGRLDRLSITYTCLENTECELSLLN